VMPCWPSVFGLEYRLFQCSSAGSMWVQVVFRHEEWICACIGEEARNICDVMLRASWELMKPAH
jgi:hypothetical protein